MMRCHRGKGGTLLERRGRGGGAEVKVQVCCGGRERDLKVFWLEKRTHLYSSVSAKMACSLVQCTHG